MREANVKLHVQRVAQSEVYSLSHPQSRSMELSSILARDGSQIEGSR